MLFAQTYTPLHVQYLTHDKDWAGFIVCDTAAWSIIHAPRSLNLFTWMARENFALRQQLVVLKRHQKQSQLKAAGRVI